MNTKIRTTMITAALAASLGLAGCATNSTPVGGNTMPGMPHGSSGPVSSMMPDANADHNQADIMFARMMIPHHAQAVEMSDIMLAKSDIPADVTTLATRIKAAQAPEIEQMTGWLKAWNQPTGMMDGTTMPGHSMGGMVDAEGIERLKSAAGTDAVRLFLTQMIGHHEGAITMAKQEISAGKYPEATDLCRAIVTSQAAEIVEMKSLLAGL
ncbi:DUF305 domain-containing protein [Pseudarthrobacter sulfonivorans]|uniref:DUF305 domain-containing protein n=1 Tax=Pseudarthrobacter sulfonivorans TaxID=121292 RepID=UPI002864AD03|nr:DUF305 domain-containing protein [Pseudarthrobacter sulfonivorans]MDR6414943.1 uncharacterized protein (DUF305 family) [Pseudarthrobacter sulfonivorans]